MDKSLSYQLDITFTLFVGEDTCFSALSQILEKLYVPKILNNANNGIIYSRICTFVT